MKRNKGAAAVEFALVVPLISLLMFSLIDFGRMYYVQISLEAASHEAVRASALNEVTEHCVVTGIPGSDCPGGSHLSRDVFLDVAFVAQQSADIAASISTLGKIDKVDVTVTRACSISYNQEFTEVLVEVDFDWLIPAPTAAMENLTISARGFMKCFT